MNPNAGRSKVSRVRLIFTVFPASRVFPRKEKNRLPNMKDSPSKKEKVTVYR